MKSKTSTFFFFFFFSFTLVAQSFSFSAGAYTNFNRVVYHPTGSAAAKHTQSSDVGVVVAPGFNFLSFYRDRMNLSLRSKIGLGINAEKADMRFQFHAPILVGLSYGKPQTSYTSHPLDYFLEAGYEFSRIIGSGQSMIARDGIRFDIGLRYNDFELSFHQILIDDKINTFGFSLLYNIE